jgi:acid phosphatase
METYGYEKIIGNPSAEYINSLAAQYAVADQYYAISHPSLPNYLALLGGDTFGITEDCDDCFLDRPSLPDQLDQHGFSWRSYQEDLPGPCFLGAEAGDYRVRHNPFLYFRAVRDNPERCRQVVPLADLDADIAASRVPDLAWISPNLRHDMHDGSIADGDQWLASFVPRLLASDAWQQGGLLIITWDEADGSNAGPAPESACCAQPRGGHVLTLVISPGSESGYHSSAAATHYSLLRAIEDGWGLSHLGHTGDPDVPGMSDLIPALKPA